MAFIGPENGRWVGMGIAGDYRREDAWYFESVKDEIPKNLLDGEFETAEEYGEAIRIHATNGWPGSAFQVDWDEVGAALTEADYDYSAEDAANVGKEIERRIVGRHDDHLSSIRDSEPGMLDRVLDGAYELVGGSRQNDYDIEKFAEQNEEAWSRVEPVTTEEAVEVAESYSATSSVIGG
jgi:hypothetical protein